MNRTALSTALSATVQTDPAADPLAGLPVEVRDAVSHLPPLVQRPLVETWSGFGTSGLYGSMAKGTFPRPIKLGQNSVAWLRADLARWLAGKLAVARAAEAEAARRAGVDK